MPEYGEQQALEDFDAEPEPEAPSEPTDVAEAGVEASREPELDASLTCDELELPEYGEQQALEDSDAEPEPEAPSEPSGVAEADVEASREPELDPSLTFDELELPEYGEQQALEDFEAEPDLEAPSEQVGVAEAGIENSREPELDPSLTFDEQELPEYGEQQALEDSESLETKDDTPPEPELDSVAFNDADLPEYDEQQALADFEQATQAADEQASAAQSTSALGPRPVENYDKQTFDELLKDETPSKHSFDFSRPMDSEVSDSAGLDLEAMLEMGGEDWNGFNLSPEQQAAISDDIPEEEQGIWSDAQFDQPDVQDENWAEQEDLPTVEASKPAYRTIDELMAEVEQSESSSGLEDDELKLDVGLNDFPDVIGDIGHDEDIDANSEAAGKLDLAKIYIEMNDPSGAIKLLEEAIVDGSDDIRREAKNLIDAIYGR